MWTNVSFASKRKRSVSDVATEHSESDKAGSDDVRDYVFEDLGKKLLKKVKLGRSLKMWTITPYWLEAWVLKVSAP